MITSTKKRIIRSLVNDNCPLAISYALKMFNENDFELHGGDHCENGTYCTLKHEESGVIIKLSARKFFGCDVTLIEDPNDILK